MTRSRSVLSSRRAPFRFALSCKPRRRTRRSVASGVRGGAATFSFHQFCSSCSSCVDRCFRRDSCAVSTRQAARERPHAVECADTAQSWTPEQLRRAQRPAMARSRRCTNAKKAESGGGVLGPVGVEQCRQMFSRIEHAGANGRLRNLENLRNLSHRLLVIIGEVNDFPMRRRQLRQSLAQEYAFVLLFQNAVRAVRGS